MKDKRVEIHVNSPPLPQVTPREIAIYMLYMPCKRCGNIMERGSQCRNCGAWCR